MEIMLAALALLLLVLTVALGALLARAVMARLKAERDLATARQQVLAGERRLADFELLKQESLLATKAALLETGQQLSSKLLDDHKRENAEAKKDSEERVRQAGADLVKQVGDLAKTVQQLSGQVQQKGETLDTLWRTLSSPGGAGQLAEVGLANTLQSFGLEHGRDFLLQHTTQDEETGRRLRPDAVVFLPGDSVLVIDCKASKFLVEIARAEGTAEEESAYRNLARSMNLHLRALAEKDYKGAIAAAWRQSGRSDEIARIFSVMYLPNEAVLEKLYRADAEFMRKAQEKEIIAAGPAGLYCVISIASTEINILRQVDNQKRIVEMTQSLLDSVTVMLSYAAAVGRGIRSSAESFAKLTASVNQRLLPRARNLAKLGVQPGKALPGNLPSYAVHSQEDTLIDGDATELVDAEIAAAATAAAGELRRDEKCSDSARDRRPHLTLPLRGSLPLRPGGAERAGVRWGESRTSPSKTGSQRD
jgi:DNA recombination protein RmuC